MLCQRHDDIIFLMGGGELLNCMNLELSGTSTKYDDDHETKSILRRAEEEKKVSVQFAAWGSSIMEF